MMGGARFGIVALAGLALALAGCGEGIEGLRKPGGLLGPDLPSAGAPLAPNQYRVKPGDTLYGLARRNNLPIKALIDTNALRPPYGLIAGQVLTIPTPEIHTVAAGETLNVVAQRYGVSTAALAQANDIGPPYRLQAGQRLILPGRKVGAPLPPIVVATTPGAQPSVAATDPNAPLGGGTVPAPGAGRATIPGGATIEVSALPPPSAPATSAPAPNAPASAPRPGASDPGTTNTPAPLEASSREALSVSQAARAELERGASVDAPAAATPAPAAVPADQGALSTPSPTVQSPSQVAAATAPTSADLSPDPAPPARSEAEIAVPPRGGKSFLWPVRGRIVAAFGERQDGLHNDGINIAAPRGTTVRAAENGVVAYAGEEIKGFGKLLLIRHADGYMTAYAHNDTLLVQRGETVRRGQPISKVGSSGNVTSPQLHFEVRKGTSPVDPEKYLGSPNAA